MKGEMGVMVVKVAPVTIVEVVALEVKGYVVPLNSRDIGHKA